MNPYSYSFPYSVFGIDDVFIFLFWFFLGELIAFFVRRVIVITGKTINPQGPLLVRVEGRRAGFIAWLMKLCRIETSFSFSVYKDRIEWNEDSFFWQKTNFIKLENVSALEVSYASSIFWFMLTLIIVFSGINYTILTRTILPLFIFLFFAVLTFGAFIFSKKYGLKVYSPASMTRILVRRSLIEGETLTLYELEAIRQVFRYLMDPENSEINLEEALASMQTSQAPRTPGNLGFSTRGAAARTFSSVIPQPPVPSVPPVPQSLSGQPDPLVPPVPPAPPVSSVPPRTIPPRSVPPRNVPPQNPPQFR